MRRIDAIPIAREACGGQPSLRSAVVAHAVPFVAWMVLMSALNYAGPDGAWKYAVRTGLCLVLFVALRPWRWYSAPKLKNVPLAVTVGVLVYVIWVFPEIRWSDRMPMVQDLYQRFGIFPLGSLPEAEVPSIYDPAVCGWPLSLVRLAGSAFVIAVIEEFFWRGFLYRWLVEREFTRLDLGCFDGEAFAMAALFFGFEHHRWLAGIVAGVAYALLMIRTRDIWAATLAHVVTNFMLGVYVLGSGNYVFW